MAFIVDYAGALGQARQNYRKEKQYIQDQKDAAVDREVKQKRIKLLDDEVSRSAINTAAHQDKVTTAQRQADSNLGSTKLANEAASMRNEKADKTLEGDIAATQAKNELAKKQADSDSTLVDAKANVERYALETKRLLNQLKQKQAKGEIDLQGMNQDAAFQDAYMGLVDSTVAVARTDPRSAAKSIAAFDIDDDGKPDIPSADSVKFETKTDADGNEYEEMIVLDPEGGVAMDMRKGGEARYDMREIDGLRDQLAANKKLAAKSGAKAPKPITPEQTTKIEGFAEKAFLSALGNRKQANEGNIKSDDPNELGYHQDFVQQNWTGAVEQHMRTKGVGAGEARRHYRGNAGIVMALTGTTRKRAEQIINDPKLGATEQERLVYAIQRVQNIGKAPEAPQQ